jgi:RNA polymerase sigma-70 factor (ECF subfamily)
VAAKKAEEEQLIQNMIGYQQGNLDDFAKLYAALSAPLVRYLWTFVRNATTADDLLQDTFLQIHRARHTYTPPRPVRPWIYAISRHVALMHLRSTRRRKEYLADDELPEFPVLPEAEKYGDRRTVHRLLGTLPTKAQEVLILHHLLGLNFTEVGDVLGIATGTAKVRAHRAIKVLRNQIKAVEQA